MEDLDLLMASFSSGTQMLVILSTKVTLLFGSLLDLHSQGGGMDLGGHIRHHLLYLKHLTQTSAV